MSGRERIRASSLPIPISTGTENNLPPASSSVQYGGNPLSLREGEARRENITSSAGNPSVDDDYVRPPFIHPGFDLAPPPYYGIWNEHDRRVRELEENIEALQYGNNILRQQINESQHGRREEQNSNSGYVAGATGTALLTISGFLVGTGVGASEPLLWAANAGMWGGAGAIGVTGAVFLCLTPKTVRDRIWVLGQSACNGIRSLCPSGANTNNHQEHELREVVSYQG